MEKEGLERFFSHALFIAMIIVVLGVLYVSLRTGSSLTGNAVYEADEATTSLESALNGALFLQSLDQTSACFIISGDEEHVLSAQKIGGEFTVSEENSCSSGADLVLKFVDYDSFLDITQDFSVSNLKSGMGGEKFYILPSTHVETGGNVLCDASFKARYCDSLTFFGTPEELISGDLSCCIDKLSKDQQKLLEAHLASGLYSDEGPQLESPALAGLSTYVFIGILGVLILLGGTAVFLHMTKKTPAPIVDPKVEQLKSYVSGVIAQGYSMDQVYAYLKQQGWPDETLAKVFHAPSNPVNQASKGPGKV